MAQETPSTSWTLISVMRSYVMVPVVQKHYEAYVSKYRFYKDVEKQVSHSPPLGTRGGNLIHTTVIRLNLNEKFLTLWRCRRMKPNHCPAT